MMALSTKLAALVFVLPLSILIISDVIGFLIFGVLYIEVIAIFTSNWVFLLVWERLRESLDKKLEYLDDNVFIGLYSELESGSLFFKQGTIDKAKNELQKHGKFIRMNLYPKNLLKELNAFLKLHNSFHEKIEQLPKLAQEEKGANLDKWTLWGFLGFKTNYPIHSQEEVLVYVATAEAIKEKHSQLLNETLTLYEKLIIERKEYSGNLKSFLNRIV